MTAPAPAPAAAGRPFRVIVLTNSDHGWQTAGVLAGVPGVEMAAVVSAPERRRPLKARLRTLRRKHGTVGAAVELGRKLGARASAWARRLVATPTPPTPRPPGVADLHFADLHAPECLAAVRALAPDLAIVDGTYILKPELFDLPRLGSINLHCGKLPEYRGAPPAFWELLAGETQVGVTVHQVTAKLDEGPIYNQVVLPLDPAPVGDPVDYVRRYWLDTLRPAGHRLLAKTVAELATGTATATRQAPHEGTTYRTPDSAARAELRRRVRARRAGAASAPPAGPAAPSRAR